MSGQGRQWILPGLIKQALCQQLALALLEGLLQSAEPRRFNMLNDDLEVAPVLVEGHLAADPDLITLFRECADALIHAPEHSAANLALAVLQREVPMSGGGA